MKVQRTAPTELGRWEAPNGNTVIVSSGRWGFPTPTTFGVSVRQWYVDSKGTLRPTSYGVDVPEEQIPGLIEWLQQSLQHNRKAPQ